MENIENSHEIFLSEPHQKKGPLCKGGYETNTIFASNINKPTKKSQAKIYEKPSYADFLNTLGKAIRGIGVIKKGIIEQVRWRREHKISMKDIMTKIETKIKAGGKISISDPVPLLIGVKSDDEMIHHLDIKVLQRLTATKLNEILENPIQDTLQKYNTSLKSHGGKSQIEHTEGYYRTQTGTYSFSLELKRKNENINFDTKLYIMAVNDDNNERYIISFRAAQKILQQYQQYINIAKNKDNIKFVSCYVKKTPLQGLEIIACQSQKITRYWIEETCECQDKITGDYKNRVQLFDPQQHQHPIVNDYSIQEIASKISVHKRYEQLTTNLLEALCNRSKIISVWPCKGFFLEDDRIVCNLPPQKPVDPTQLANVLQQISDFLHVNHNPQKASAVFFTSLALPFSLIRKQLGQRALGVNLYESARCGKTTLANLCTAVWTQGGKQYAGDAMSSSYQYGRAMAESTLPILVDDNRSKIFAADSRIIELIKNHHSTTINIRAPYRKDAPEGRLVIIGARGVLYTMNKLPIETEQAINDRFYHFRYDNEDIFDKKEKLPSVTRIIQQAHILSNAFVYILQNSPPNLSKVLLELLNSGEYQGPIPIYYTFGKTFFDIVIDAVFRHEADKIKKIFPNPEWANIPTQLNTNDENKIFADTVLDEIKRYVGKTVLMNRQNDRQQINWIEQLQIANNATFPAWIKYSQQTKQILIFDGIFKTLKNNITGGLANLAHQLQLKGIKAQYSRVHRSTRSISNCVKIEPQCLIDYLWNEIKATNNIYPESLDIIHTKTTDQEIEWKVMN